MDRKDEYKKILEALETKRNAFKVAQENYDYAKHVTLEDVAELYDIIYDTRDEWVEKWRNGVEDGMEKAYFTIKILTAEIRELKKVKKNFQRKYGF